MSASAACGTSANERMVTHYHPCFSEHAHGAGGRIHLPVAPACNVQCAYCVRRYDCVNESRPGVASVVLSPAQAIERVEAVIERGGDIAAIGVAGPGDPLANEATFEALDLVRRRYPDRIGCVSTNGLALPERVPDLIAAGVRSITITINAVMPETAACIYTWVTGPAGERLRGLEAGRYILDRQWEGLRRAIEAGLVVKVNSVLIPDVNDAELPVLAHLAAEYGASRHNILPLIPQGAFRRRRPPTHGQLRAARAACSEYLSQMTHCAQCRADACGAIGQDRDMETEVLLARLGDDYAEAVC